MDDASLAKVLDDFGNRVGSLFGSRPYWLVHESLVRSELVAALLAQKHLFPERHAIDARHISTEAELGGEVKIDLVARPIQMPPIAVELKGWNIVTKFRDGLVGSSNASAGYVAAQISGIGSDIMKLGRIVTQQPDAVCLLVVYAQEPLDGEGARRFAGRRHDKPLRHSICDVVASPESLRECLEQDLDGQALEVALDEVWRSKSSFTCAVGTRFHLMAFRIGPHDPG